jgi:hypothetical protein
MRVRPIISLVVAVALLCTACGSSGSAEVQAFSEVQDSAFLFETDPSDPSRSIFRVTTTEPMICANVWGETDDFGRFNNSLAMNGTGIIDHDVVLPDAEPGVTYTFQVQGSTADGTLYQSEVGTFTVAEPPAAQAAAPEADSRPNLSLSATGVEVSSEFSDDWTGANAIDGDTTTEWATAGDGDEGFITIDLGPVQAVGGVEFVTRSMADGSSITDTYTVTVGEEVFGPFAASTVAAPNIVELEVEAGVLRFDIESSTGGNVGAVEVRILGAG